MKDIYKQKKQTKEAIVFLLIAMSFVLLLLISVTISYFSEQKTAQGNIVLGELDFCIYENGASIENIVPGDVFARQVVLVNSRNNAGNDTSGLCSIFVRFIIDVEGENQIISPQFSSTTDWTRDGDTYYYNHAISPSEVVNLCDALVFSEHAGNEYQNTILNITFDVNAIQAENGAYLELWNDAPQSWKSQIGS